MKEEATKMGLINPVLVALGWKTDDCTEVDYEFRPESVDNPVDYALMIDRVPKLLVEAKALGSDLSDRKFVAQILKYAFMADVTWCVLTDGDEYCIYNATASVKTDERLLCRFRISENSEEYAAGKLALLSRSNLQSTDLESFWAEHFVDRQVRTTLQAMLRQHDKGLVGLIRKATKLKPKEIVESLCRLNITLDPPSPPGRPAPVTGTASPSTGEVIKVPPKPIATGKKVTPADLIAAGLLKPPLGLFFRYKGQKLEATLLADGGVEYQGQRYGSPSAAAAAARATISGRTMATDGWATWQVQGADGKSRTLADVRDAYGRPAPARQIQVNIPVR
jgi:hypothetical protein